MKEWKKETKEREYKEERRKDNVSMWKLEHANDNGSTMSSPQAVACLWLPLPSSGPRPHPSSSWCSLHEYRALHTFIRTCVHAVLPVKQAEPSPSSFVTVGLVAPPLEQQRPNSVGISPGTGCPDWDFTRFLSCTRECRYSSLTKDISQVLSSYLHSGPSPAFILPFADFRYLRFRICIHFCKPLYVVSCVCGF